MENCATYRERFSEYVDGRLDAQHSAQLHAHLATCARCAGDVESLRRIRQALHAMGQVPAPDLLPGIQARLARQPWWRTLAQRFLAPWPVSLPLHGLALATTAVLVVFVVGLPQLANHQETQRRDTGLDGSGSLVGVTQSPQPPARSYDKGVGIRGSETETNAYRDDRPSTRDESTSPASIPAQSVSTTESGKTIGHGLLSASNVLEKNEMVRATTLGASAGGQEAVSRDTAEMSSSSRRRAGAPAQSIPSTRRLVWRVNDVAATALQVNVWVRQRGGVTSPPTNFGRQQLTIVLAETDLPSFFVQFPAIRERKTKAILALPDVRLTESIRDIADFAVTVPVTAPTSDSTPTPRWVHIELEIIPIE